eukprot:jgi/Tetstr1/449414/TSEL_036509.t1
MATATAMAHSSFSGGEDALPPLHFAALNSSTGAVDALLTGGAPAGSVAPASGLPPLHYAVSNPDAGVLRALLAAGAPVDGGPGPAAARGGLTPLLLAAWLGNYTAVVDLLTAGANIHRVDSNHKSALILAASNGHSAVINKLLSAGADVNQARPDRRRLPDRASEDSCGGTAVEWAALEGQLDAVRTLATHGADLTHKDFNGRTALILAALQGHDNVVAELLRWDGAHLASMTDMDGRTALHWAAVQGHQQVVRQLAAVPGAEATLMQPDAASRSPMMLAAQYGRPATVCSLLQSVATCLGEKAAQQAAVAAARMARSAGFLRLASTLDPSISASASVTSSPQCSVVDDSELAWMSGLQSGEAARGFRTPRAYGVDPVPPSPLTASSTVSKTPLVPLPPSAAAGSARLSQTFLKPLAPGSSHRSPARRGLALPAMGSPQAAESSKNIGTPAVQEIMVDLRHASVFPGSPVRGAKQGIAELVDGSSPGPPRTCASPQAQPGRAAPRPAATGQRASGLLQPGFSFVGTEQLHADGTSAAPKSDVPGPDRVAELAAASARSTAAAETVDGGQRRPRTLSVPASPVTLPATSPSPVTLPAMSPSPGGPASAMSLPSPAGSTASQRSSASRIPRPSPRTPSSASSFKPSPSPSPALPAPAMRRSDNAAGGRQQYGKRLSKSMVTPMERHGLAADDDRSLRPAYNRSQLVQAAADGLLSKVVVQLAQGAAVDARDSQGSTALLLACCGGHLQVVETLLAHSAQVDAANDAGRHA